MPQQRAVDRLGEVIGRAHRIGAVDRLRILQPGDHQHRQVFPFRQPAQFGTGCETVHPRHDDIEQDDIRRRLPHQLQRLRTACRLEHAVAALLQHLTQNGAHERFVVDDQRPDVPPRYSPCLHGFLTAIDRALAVPLTAGWHSLISTSRSRFLNYSRILHPSPLTVSPSTLAMAAWSRSIPSASGSMSISMRRSGRVWR